MNTRCSKGRQLLRVLLWFVAAFVFSSAAVAKDIRWITIGTSGGPSVQIERAQISNALVVGDAVYIFDAGNDVQRQLAKANVAERNLRAVFLTHHHLDHNANLGPLIVTHWMFGSGKLGVFGPAGSRTLVSGLVSANAPPSSHPFQRQVPGSLR
jgi:ribonuclease BN (tRNA processing enzyme)